MKAIGDDQVTVARWGTSARAGKIDTTTNRIPKRFHQRTKAEQQKKVDENFRETLAALIELSKFNGMYDHDDDDNINDKSRKGKLGISQMFWEARASQSITNKFAENVVATEEHDEVASHAFTSSATGGHILETPVLHQVEAALNVLAELVNTVNPYDVDDQLYPQYPKSWQELIKTGYDMVDHSVITPWPVGDKKVYTEKRGDRIIEYTSAMRTPAKFDLLGAADESLYVQSQRQHLRNTVRDFASSAGFGSTNRDSTDTQTQPPRTTALPESGPSTSGFSNPSNKPSRVSFAG
jgi:hypothetical protein